MKRGTWQELCFVSRWCERTPTPKSARNVRMIPASVASRCLPRVVSSASAARVSLGLCSSHSQFRRAQTCYSRKFLPAVCSASITTDAAAPALSAPTKLEEAKVRRCQLRLQLRSRPSRTTRALVQHIIEVERMPCWAVCVASRSLFSADIPPLSDPPRQVEGAAPEKQKRTPLHTLAGYDIEGVSVGALGTSSLPQVASLHQPRVHRPLARAQADRRPRSFYLSSRSRSISGGARRGRVTWCVCTPSAGGGLLADPYPRVRRACAQDARFDSACVPSQRRRRLRPPPLLPMCTLKIIP